MLDLRLWKRASRSSSGSHDASGGRTSSSSGIHGVSGSDGGIGGTSREASSGDGGGARTTVGGKSVFAGREMGGGTRDQIYGTSEYGSGYPYGADASASASVKGRPFPFGFWPISVFPPIPGSEEYGPPSNISRVGGPMQTVQFQYNSSESTPDVYHALGDRTSVYSILDPLVKGCNATILGVWLYSDNSTTVLASTIIQYYRASSFALALDGYNSNNTSDFPQTLNRTFLHCVNATIGQTLPILDAHSAAWEDNKTLIGFVVPFGLLAIVAICYWFCSPVYKRKKKQARPFESGAYGGTAGTAQDWSVASRSPPATPLPVYTRPTSSVGREGVRISSQFELQKVHWQGPVKQTTLVNRRTTGGGEIP